MGFWGIVYPRAGLPQICEKSDSSLGLERREGSVVGRASEDGEVVEKPHVEEKGGGTFVSVMAWRCWRQRPLLVLPCCNSRERVYNPCPIVCGRDWGKRALILRLLPHVFPC